MNIPIYVYARIRPPIAPCDFTLTATSGSKAKGCTTHANKNRYYSVFAHVTPTGSIPWLLLPELDGKFTDTEGQSLVQSAHASKDDDLEETHFMLTGTGSALPPSADRAAHKSLVQLPNTMIIRKINSNQGGSVVLGTSKKLNATLEDGVASTEGNPHSHASRPSSEKAKISHLNGQEGDVGGKVNVTKLGKRKPTTCADPAASSSSRLSKSHTSEHIFRFHKVFTPLVRLTEEVFSSTESTIHPSHAETRNLESTKMCTNQLIFDEAISPQVQLCLENYYNLAVLSYGQTGSGKTFTMCGNSVVAADQGGDRDGSRQSGVHAITENTGLIQHTLSMVYDSLYSLLQKEKQEECRVAVANPNAGARISPRVNAASHVSVRMCALELYNETLRDLLSLSPRSSASGMEPEMSALPIRIIHDPIKGILILNAREVSCETCTEAMQTVYAAMVHRCVAATSMNSQSSRSHVIIRLHLEWTCPTSNLCNEIKNITLEPEVHCTSLCTSTFSLVDLAGSERFAKTGITASRSKDVRCQQTMSINSSLLALGAVLDALGRRNGAEKTQCASKQLCSTNAPLHHIPYRNSKLTRLLQDCIGGNAITVVIVCVSSEYSDVEETLGTLRFGATCHRVEQCVTKNVFPLVVPEISTKPNQDSSGTSHADVLVSDHLIPLESLWTALAVELGEVQHLACDVHELESTCQDLQDTQSRWHTYLDSLRDFAHELLVYENELSRSFKDYAALHEEFHSNSTTNQSPGRQCYPCASESKTMHPGCRDYAPTIDTNTPHLHGSSVCAPKYTPLVNLETSSSKQKHTSNEILIHLMRNLCGLLGIEKEWERLYTSILRSQPVPSDTSSCQPKDKRERGIEDSLCWEWEEEKSAIGSIVTALQNHIDELGITLKMAQHSASVAVETWVRDAVATYQSCAANSNFGKVSTSTTREKNGGNRQKDLRSPPYRYPSEDVNPPKRSDTDPVNSHQYYPHSDFLHDALEGAYADFYHQLESFDMNAIIRLSQELNEALQS